MSWKRKGKVTKMKRLKLMIALFLCVLCFGMMEPNFLLKTEASSTFNLLDTVSKKAVSSGRWVKNKKGYRFRYTNSRKYAKSTWLKIKGKIYYFNKYGYRISGLKSTKGNKYYLNKKGVLSFGWKYYGGNKYYFSKITGAALKGWNNIGKNKFYFNKKGRLLTNQWVGKYYVGEKGYMLTNTQVGEYYLGADGKKTVVKPNEQSETLKTIFVGDSRTVGMNYAVQSKDSYIGKVGEGYSWFSSNGINTLRKELRDEPKSKVILNLGVNDLGNVRQYIALYRKLITQYPQANFYFMSVNPIETKRAKAYGYNTKYVSNTAIKKFNTQIKETFPSAYLDCYKYLIKKKLIQNVSTGKGTVDGIHYTNAVYRAIYKYVIENTAS